MARPAIDTQKYTKIVTSNESIGCDPQDLVKPARKRGAPLGNRNRLKSGKYTKRNRANRTRVTKLKRAVRETLLLAEAALKAHVR